MKPIRLITLAAALLAPCTHAYAQASQAPPPPTKEQRDLEKALLARITKKQSDAQGFFQHWQVYHRANRDNDPAAQAYKEDADRAMGERNESEMQLVQLYFDEGRDREAVGRLGQLAKLGVPAAKAMLNDLEFEEARGLYTDYLKSVSDGKPVESKKKAALDRLWDLHRRGYKPATEALKALDVL